MFYHKYTCQLCRKNLSISSSSFINPLNGKLAVHKNVVCNGQQNSGWGWIPQAVNARCEDCSGSLIYKDKDLEIREPPPPPGPQTAADVSLEYSRNPGDKNTICGGVDITNPATKQKGVNRHGKRRASLHQSLQDILRDIERLEAWDVTNCAEIDAVDKLFKAGVASANIRVHSRDQRGDPKPPCDNCQVWLKPAENHVYKIRS